MKKILTILFITATLTFGYQTVTAKEQPAAQQNSVMRPSREQMRKEFEQRLNLSDKQKEKARQLHKQGREQMKPVIMQIELKRQEIETVKLSRIAEKMQQERITQINAEIKELEKQAQEIRKKNSQEFEKLLNKKQKAELEKMKAEGRARFEQHHPARPPFQGLSTPGLLLRPLLPPPANSNGYWK